MYNSNLCQVKNKIKQKIKETISIKKILLFIFFVASIIIIYPAAVLVWNDSVSNSYPDAPPFPIGSILTKIIIIIALIGLGKKAIKKNPLDKFDKELQNKIIYEIKEYDEKSFSEARNKYPFGGISMIGKEYVLVKDLIVKLDKSPILKDNSYKIRVLKASKGEIIKILGLESEHYIIKTRDIDKGYCESDNMFESLFYDQLDKQNKYKEKVLKQYLSKIAKKYNLSEKEVSEILFKYYGERLLKNEKD